MSKLRLLFAVQGDGRGHLTQALAVRELVRAAGHELAAVLAGHAPGRELPAFFRDKIDAPIIPIESFDLIADKQNRGVSPAATIADNVRRLPRLAAGLNVVRRHLDRHRPDVVVNFYEPIVGLAFHLFRPRIRMVAAANQYLFDHPGFEPPPGRRAEWKGLRAYNRITAPPPAVKLAFSFHALPDAPRRRVRVAPPILRPEVLAHRSVPAEDFVLVYLLKTGFLDDIRSWHATHPAVRLHCFTDRSPEVVKRKPNETLAFHALNDRTFLDLMSRCRGLVCTSGFQSLAEARWFGKPVLTVPVENHFEQTCNARDVETSGAGIAASRFDLDRFLEYIPTHAIDPEPYRVWARTAGVVFVEEIERAAGRERG